MKASDFFVPNPLPPPLELTWELAAALSRADRALAAAAVKSVETSVNSADDVLVSRQWVFGLPKEKDVLKIEKLSGNIVPGGKLSGRITGGKLSDGAKYSWEADFDFTLPAKSAAAGPSGCAD